jgi:hypothetical protein
MSAEGTKDFRLTPPYHTCCWHFEEIYKKKEKTVKTRFGIIRITSVSHQMARRQKVAKCLYETLECVISVKHSRNILMLMTTLYVCYANWTCTTDTRRPLAGIAQSVQWLSCRPGLWFAEGAESFPFQRPALTPTLWAPGGLSLACEAVHSFSSSVEVNNALSYTLHSL